MLNIDAKVMKNLVKFMLENTNSNFEEKFSDYLSVDNKSYLLKNYSVISKQNSQKESFLMIEDCVMTDKNDFGNQSELAESKSINSKSFVKVDLNDENSNDNSGFFMIK